MPPIKAYCYDEVFAIHRSEVSGRTWVVTHIPTGLIVCSFTMSRQARKIIPVLLALPVPWKSRSLKVQRRYRKVIFAVLPPRTPVG